MLYFLDSDIVNDHLAENRAATALLEQLAPEGIAVSIITYMETYQGVLRGPQPESARSKFHTFLTTVAVLPF